MDNVFDSAHGFQEITSTLAKQDPTIDIENLSDDEMLTLRAAIDDRLPVTKLQHINLHQESVIQYLQSRKLLNDIMTSDDVPPNQKAQVNNSVQANLAYLDKMQKEAYTPERNKQLETLLVRYINEMPDDEARKRFLDEYARRLGEL